MGGIVERIIIYPICNYVTDTRSGHPRPHKTRLLIVIFAVFGTSSALIARGDRQFARRLRESFALNVFPPCLSTIDLQIFRACEYTKFEQNWILSPMKKILIFLSYCVPQYQHHLFCLFLQISFYEFYYERLSSNVSPHPGRRKILLFSYHLHPFLLWIRGGGRRSRRKRYFWRTVIAINHAGRSTPLNLLPPSFWKTKRNAWNSHA